MSIARGFMMGLVGFAAAALALLAVATSDCRASDFVSIQGDQFVFRGQVMKLKGTNYYPRDHMWADLWNSWDWLAIQYEVPLIRDLGMNSVRILVPYSAGGWGGANPPANRLQKLEELVNIFGDNGIRSCVTLFDWETSFPAQGTAREQEHLSHLSAIVSRLKDNEYVCMWDVKNEPDHPANIGGYDNWDYNPAKRDQIVSWLNRMSAAVRAIDSNHPVSAGLRWWENVQDVAGFVDIAMFHSYWPNVTQQITDIRSYMGAHQKPILCEEFGWPTNPTPCYRDGSWIYDYNETQQLSVYTNHLTAFSAQNIAGCMQWMTFDAKPYTSDPYQSFEQYFGLWRYNYGLKPAGQYYRDNFLVTHFPPKDGPPGPVTRFMATPIDSGISLSWKNPPDGGFARTVVRASSSSYPGTPTSGTLVCDQVGQPDSMSSFTHSGLQNGHVYYYSAFAFDQAGHYSAAAYTSGSPSDASLTTTRLLPDGATAALAGMVVTAVFNSDGCVYVRNPQATCGIRILGSNTGLAVGDVVDVLGQIDTRYMSGQRSERQIINATINRTATAEPPRPVAMNCISVGGGPASALVPGVDGGVGLNNVGLLVKISGRVTLRINNYLWVDDGSDIPDIMGRVGVMIRCLFDPGVSAGAVVSCVGIVEGSIPTGWLTNRRCVHPRSLDDISVHDES